MKTVISAIILAFVFSGCESGESLTITWNDNNESNEVVEVVENNDTVTYDVDLWDYLVYSSETTVEKWYDGFTWNTDKELTGSYYNTLRALEIKGNDTALTTVSSNITTYNKNEDTITYGASSFKRFLNVGDFVNEVCQFMEIRPVYTPRDGYNYENAMIVYCNYGDRQSINAYQYGKGLVSAYTVTSDGYNMINWTY